MRQYYGFFTVWLRSHKLYYIIWNKVEERKSPAPSRREVELSLILRQALEPSIFLELYPKTIIDVFVQVLCADGGTRCAAATAASVALADAGIALRDLVCGVAVGKVAEPDPPTIVLDLSDIEDKEGLADLPIAMMPRTKEFTLLQFDGLITRDEFITALDLAKKGTEIIHKIQIETLKNKFTQFEKQNSELEVERSEEGET